MRRYACVVLVACLVACTGPEVAAPDALPAVTTLSPDGIELTGASYSADGKRVAYWSRDSASTQRWQLWVANADLGAAARVPVTSLVNTPPAWSPDGARLASTSNQFGASDVVVTTLASNAVQRVTRSTGINIPLHFSQHGDQLTYYGTSGTGVFAGSVANVVTGEIRALVPGETRPYVGATSPDGRHVAFMTIENSKNTIWVADSGGRNARQLTTEGFETLMQFHEWSPDGTQLLYVSRRTGTSDLWTVPIDGGKPRQLTRNVRNDYAGTWSPDGKYVAFLSDRGRQTDVWVVPSSGGEERRVTNSAAEELEPLTWRAGTNELRYTVKTEQNGLWAFDLATGAERRLTADSLRIGDWWGSPDGQQMLAVIERGGGLRDLVVLPIMGGAMRTLVSGDASINRAQWSPDGSRIAYISDRGGTEDLWVVDVAGGAPRQLETWPGAEFALAWSADGASIYILSDRESRLSDVWKIPAAGGEATRVTTTGNIDFLTRPPGASMILAKVVSARGGQYTLVKLAEDGTMTPVWDKSNVLQFADVPARDSVVAMVEQTGGVMRAMLLSETGSGGRIILEPGDSPGNASHDGRLLVYSTTKKGNAELGLLDLSNGSTRLLTTSPEAEQGAEFTRDDKTVIFMRVRRAERITAVDMTKVLPVTTAR
jgi:Tol biopolymer transport system component